MDFLDPKKRLRHTIIMLVGYVLIAVAIGIATVVLLYQAYGFGLGKNGTVIQNGLIFFSSQPHPAKIYLNGKLAKVQTNSRLVLPSGIYDVKLTRDGYVPWERQIELDGGSVEHFDYPLLIPQKLTTAKLHSYSTAPLLATQSPDRRWLLIQQSASPPIFDVYDLKAPTKEPTVITLPAALIGKSTAGETWQVSDWADDNQHVLLTHGYGGKTEYLLLDRLNPDQSVNLSQVLALPDTPPRISLVDKKYDHYYLFSAAQGSLETASLKSTALTPLLQHVLAFQSYGSGTVLYVTDDGAAAGKVDLRLFDGSQNYTIRSFPAGTSYVLDLTQYSGSLYVVAGAASTSRVYIYKDPVGQLTGNNHVDVPMQVLRVPAPNYVGFSSNAQFVVAENGQHFGVFDIENTHGYSYTASRPLDAPQSHAAWMDGDRLMYVSGGKQLIFDYDNTNQHLLAASLPAYLPAFAPDYRYTYNLAPADPSGAGVELTQTSLLAQ